MPSFWLRDEDRGVLKGMRWVGPEKADQIAALMVYIVLVHRASNEATPGDPDIGVARITYSGLSDITGLSRAKISGGLKILRELDAIDVESHGKSNSYRITSYKKKSGWAKLPTRGLYSKDGRTIPAFHQFHLRLKVELNALKLYLLILALRNDEMNYAKVSYKRLSERTGVPQTEVRSAISFLTALGLIHVDKESTDLNAYSTVNIYRPCHLDRYNHRGTQTSE